MPRRSAAAAVAAAVLLSSPSGADATCPFAAQLAERRLMGERGVPVAPHALPTEYLQSRRMELANDALAAGAEPAAAAAEDEYTKAFSELDLDAVEADLVALFGDSQDWWPADYGNYGPFFVRLAWHCSGSYRTSDGRGGCAGGRQRFEPELSWDDNTNLDKARALLAPIKLKYGLGLSWGDLFILAGTTAIKSMGGPKLGFCGGRRDDDSGAESAALGATPYQEIIAPCAVNGNCTVPVAGGTELGTTTVGLIYVNPEGFMGVPDPNRSVLDIRTTFGRMAMNDTETVALIGGGHAFGKTHGACPNGAGPNPEEAPEDPWPGLCGTGKGADAFTSGFEGPWTSTPTTWDNQYFLNLLDFDWQKHVGPGGHWQWNISNPSPPSVGGQQIMMLTSDQALLRDPSYRALVERFAADLDDFTDQFSHAWYKLTSRDMGPVTRCLGDQVAPPQPFQMPLPDPPATLPDFDAVATDVRTMLTTPNDAVLPLDSTGSYGPLMVRLAWQCANTFRSTDYQGGCNGARIRYAPESGFTNNGYLDKALALLQGVKDKYGDSLTWADLIVLAGGVAVEDAAYNADGVSIEVPFVGGRSDATPESVPTPAYLESRLTGGRDLHEGTVGTIDIMRDTAEVLGLTAREYVALVGGGHSLGQTHTARSGFVDGAWTSEPAALDVEFFTNLATLRYTPVAGADSSHLQWQATNADGQTVYMLNTDLNLYWDTEFRAVVDEFAQDGGAEAFYHEFTSAWGKVMNADRFDVDTNPVTPDGPGDGEWDTGKVAGLAVGVLVLGLVVGVGLTALVTAAGKRSKARLSVSGPQRPTTVARGESRGKEAPELPAPRTTYGATGGV